MTYRQIHGGGGLDIVPGDIFDLACCCCGLVHTVRVSELPEGLRLQFASNRRATAGIRRAKGVRARLEALVMGWLRR